ncbi:MAG: hypothetical protein JO025_23530 [Verrucomicrobia bacterium]|nr:hypothetical protein [Verrucomicrobiota bacterium]
MPRINGKRERKFFRNREDAERELGEITKKLRRHGEKALLISDAQCIEAIDAVDRLKPFGVSLKETVSFYIAGHQQSSGTVEAAITEYLKNQGLKQRSKRHIDNLNYRLRVFKEQFGPRFMDTLSIQEVEEWLHGLEQAPKSLNNFHTAVSALFSFSVKRSFIGPAHSKRSLKCGWCRRLPGF